jgi:hypothetical protein
MSCRHRWILRSPPVAQGMMIATRALRGWRAARQVAPAATDAGLGWSVRMPPPRVFCGVAASQLGNL